LTVLEIVVPNARLIFALEGAVKKMRISICAGEDM